MGRGFTPCSRKEIQQGTRVGSSNRTASGGSFSSRAGSILAAGSREQEAVQPQRAAPAVQGRHQTLSGGTGHTCSFLTARLKESRRRLVCN